MTKSIPEKPVPFGMMDFFDEPSKFDAEQKQRVAFVILNSGNLVSAVSRPSGPRGAHFEIDFSRGKPVSEIFAETIRKWGAGTQIAGVRKESDPETNLRLFGWRFKESDFDESGELKQEDGVLTDFEFLDNSTLTILSHPVRRLGRALVQLSCLETDLIGDMKISGPAITEETVGDLSVVHDCLALASTDEIRAHINPIKSVIGTAIIPRS